MTTFSANDVQQIINEFIHDRVFNVDIDDHYDLGLAVGNYLPNSRDEDMMANIAFLQHMRGRVPHPHKSFVKCYAYAEIAHGIEDVDHFYYHMTNRLHEYFRRYPSAPTFCLPDNEAYNVEDIRVLYADDVTFLAHVACIIGTNAFANENYEPRIIEIVRNKSINLWGPYIRPLYRYSLKVSGVIDDIIDFSSAEFMAKNYDMLASLPRNVRDEIDERISKMRISNTLAAKMSKRTTNEEAAKRAIKASRITPNPAKQIIMMDLDDEEEFPPIAGAPAAVQAST